MRTLTAIAVILLVLISCLSFTPSGTNAVSVPDQGDVHLTRVCPAYPGEFITLKNFGSAVDLCGWRLSDGEGSVTMNSSTILITNAEITWCQSSERFSALYSTGSFFDRNITSLVTKGSLKLADTGDEVILQDSRGIVVDMLYYGNAEPSSPWRGTSVPCKKGEMMERVCEGIGSNSWGISVPGSFSVSTSKVNVIATPILYPDDGLTALVREIDRSVSSVNMATYLLENWTLARHLSMAEARGVDVTLLLEGQPVGGISENGAALAYYLQGSGVNVSIMRSSDGFRRYDYHHAKYVVFDGMRLLVTSENMADSSFESNRGWAVLVESEELSQGALSVFSRDVAGAGLDIFPLELSAAYQEGSPGRSLAYDKADTASKISAYASLISSPNEIGDALVDMLGGAQRRILVQQMRIDEDWLEGNVVMDALLLAAERGVEVKVLLDAGLGTEESNERVVKALNSLAVSKGWDLEGRMTSDQSPFERMHNKGVIVDDTVLVGSANWVDNSMWQNREMALMLTSSELSDTYAQWFHEDWLGDVVPPQIDLPWRYLEVRKGDTFVLDATACSDASGIADFAWDVNGDGRPDLIGPLQAVSLPAGDHVITLTVTDVLGNQANETLTVNVTNDEEGVLSVLLYAPVPAVALLIILRFRGRRIK